MADPCNWAELQRLAQNIAAAHIAMVAFLESADVPWSDEQSLEFARISLARVTALNEYIACVDLTRKGSRELNSRAE